MAGRNPDQVLTGDVSADGVFVMTPRLLPVGTVVKLQVLLADGPVHADATVVRQRVVPRPMWSMTPQGMGLRFSAPQKRLDFSG